MKPHMHKLRGLTLRRAGLFLSLNRAAKYSEAIHAVAVLREEIDGGGQAAPAMILTALVAVPFDEPIAKWLDPLSDHSVSFLLRKTKT
jgi:hypothetical protein